jgi:uncharacterized protein (TIGR02284 family)
LPREFVPKYPPDAKARACQSRDIHKQNRRIAVLARELRKDQWRVIMAVNREELIECLNDLIHTCRDGENGFQTAADHVRDAGLKSFFADCSVQRAQFASELESEVRQLGGTPAKSGSVSAAFHRGWMNIKSIVTGGSTDAIVAECERGEDAAVANYQQVLKKNLPPNVLPVVKHQFTEIKRAHDRIRDLDQAA